MLNPESNNQLWNSQKTERYIEHQSNNRDIHIGTSIFTTFIVLLINFSIISSILLSYASSIADYRLITKEYNISSKLGGKSEREREIRGSACITTLPTCPIIIRRTNHEYRISLTFPNGSPPWTIFIFIGAFSAIRFRWDFFPTNGSYVKEFGGIPHFPLKDGASSMGSTLVRRCIRMESEKQNSIPFNRSQDATTLCTIEPNLTQLRKFRQPLMSSCEFIT